MARPASLSASQSGISSTATARLWRIVWVAFLRLRLSCESERFSFSDSSNVGVGPGEKASDFFVSTSPPRLWLRVSGRDARPPSLYDGGLVRHLCSSGTKCPLLCRPRPRYLGRVGSCPRASQRRCPHS